MRKNNKMPPTLVIPFLGTGVGGAQVSSMILARTLKYQLGWNVHIAVPTLSAHSDLTRKNNIETDTYASRLYSLMQQIPAFLRKTISRFVFFTIALRYLYKLKPDYINLVKGDFSRSEISSLAAFWVESNF